MSDQNKKNKKRKKSYYKKCSNKRQKFLNSLDVGMRGFLITCNNNERQAVRESYNILNEYSDILFGPEQPEPEKSRVEDSGESSEEEDMQKEMEKEIAALKTEKVADRRFQNVYTKAKNCIFIKTTLEDPCQVAHSILTDLAESKKQKTRFAQRLLPISGTCRAIEDDIEGLAKTMFPPHFDKEEGLSFTIVHKVRNNDSIGRASILPLLGKVVRDMNALHKVCHDEPDVVILIEIIGKICCMSVVKDFLKLRKYNLHEVTKINVEDNGEEGEQENFTQNQKTQNLGNTCDQEIHKYSTDNIEGETKDTNKSDNSNSETVKQEHDTSE
ncbi:hypothetical protein ScPMuIL_005127 [Solemya velum]